MKKLLVAFALLLLSVNFSNAQTDIYTQIRSNVNWLNGSNDAPPSRIITMLYPVPVGNGKYFVRGFLSARACLNRATVFAICGDDQSAIEWLMAGQAHNEGVQRMFLENATYTLRYIKDTYSAQALAECGASAFTGGYYDIARQIRGVILANDVLSEAQIRQPSSATQAAAVQNRRNDDFHSCCHGRGG